MRWVTNGNYSSPIYIYKISISHAPLYNFPRSRLYFTSEVFVSLDQLPHYFTHLHTQQKKKKSTTMPGLYMLDYGAGNVRSLVNAVNRLGFEMKFVEDPSDILKADVSVKKYQLFLVFGHVIYIYILESSEYVKCISFFCWITFQHVFYYHRNLFSLVLVHSVMPWKLWIKKVIPNL